MFYFVPLFYFRYAWSQEIMLEQQRPLLWSVEYYAKDAASEPNVIEGKVFREMSETAREDIADKITVNLH